MTGVDTSRLMLRMFITGIHGKRTRWGSTPPREMERDALETEIRRSGERRLERGRDKRGEVNGFGGEETSLCPDLTPWSRPSAVVPRWGAVVPLISGSTAHHQR